MENFKRSDEEHQDDEPLHKKAEKFPDIKREASPACGFVKTSRAQRLVEAKCLHNLDNHMVERNPDNPTHDKPNHRSENLWQHTANRIPKTPEGPLYRTR